MDLAQTFPDTKSTFSEWVTLSVEANATDDFLDHI